MSLFNIKSKFLTSLKVDLATSRLIHIREGNLADANFVVTYILKEILSDESNSLLFVNFHNSISHYQNIGRRIHYNLNEKIAKKHVASISPLEHVQDLISGVSSWDVYLESLKNSIKQTIEELSQRNEGKVFLVIDDLSHLVDLEIPYKELMYFVNFCVDLQDNDRVWLVIGSHSNEEEHEDDLLMSNLISYVSDVDISISSLKTGVSQGVSGVINVNKKDCKDIFHYKTSDKFVQVFSPGATFAAMRI